VPVCLVASITAGAHAQETPPPQDTTVDIGWLLGDDDRGGLRLTSGKTYNRVEGLPVLFGPTYRAPVGPGELTLAALGIIRSAHDFAWNSENIGHRLTADLRVGRRRGFAVGLESFDVMARIEPWQLPEPDGALAAFFLKRDYFDWFARHGGRAHASVFRPDLTFGAGYSHERWSSRRERDVWTVLRGDEAWRNNPPVNDGRAHVFDLNLHLDTRNSALDPLAGWFIDAQYEYGRGDFAAIPIAVVDPPAPPDQMRLEYGRLFVDVRRYNRISPRRRLNGRLVLGGWLHGDELPYQRRFSVGGIGTLPGFDYRLLGIGTDVGQCSEPRALGPIPGRPAECERVALAQVEYRQELPSELFDVFNRNRIRVRGAVFRVKPDVVVFADAGRGWLVGGGRDELRYGSRSLPPFDTFRTDVGIGLDLGIAGMYIAKAVSEAEEPANFFIRIRSRL
jgi:hypothetical protein